MIPTGPFGGIHAAIPCPLDEQGAIDTAALEGTLAWLGSVPGLAGFLVNGHAGENFLLDRGALRHVLEVAVGTVGQTHLVVAGINAESTAAAAALARDAEAAGADALMVFPPNAWAAFQDDDTAVTHHRGVIDATTLPVMLFQAAVTAGAMAYRPDVLERLVQLPRIVAIKDGSWEVARYEANRRLVKAVAPDVAVMGSGDEHLFTSYVIGSEGSLVSLAAVIPEPIIALDRAVREGDLAEARRQHERLYPLARAVYGAPPAGRATARLKTCLKLLGRFPGDAVVPPYAATPVEEHEGLRAALAQAGAFE